VAAQKAPEKPKTTDAWDKFKPKAGSWECPGCLLRQDGDLIQCPACQTAKPGHEEAVKAKEAAAAPEIAFGPTGGFTFGGPPQSTQPPAQTQSSPFGGFSFGAAPIVSASAPGFSFSVAKAAATTMVPAFSVTPTATTPKTSTDADSTGEPETDEHDHHDPHFEPIIPLPDLVEVTTGEEDEEVVFQHRAKVFR
jgi:E3 SUMO-protein ligase RanBP2